MYDQAGNVVARYGYDAWGKLLSVKDGSGNVLTPTTNSTHIGILNPFRYRGYFYDDESGLYYLNSRYYDPQTGRFVNSDSILVLDNLLGTNLYAYCANDPVNNIDANGFAHQTIKKGAKGSEVRLLQAFLKRFGYRDQNGNDLVIDGDFGAKTDFALRNYQRDFGLTPDGIAGKNTWNLIDQHMSPDGLNNEIMNAAKDPWYSRNSIRIFRDQFVNPVLDSISSFSGGVSGFSFIISRSEWGKRITFGLSEPFFLIVSEFAAASTGLSEAIKYLLNLI